MRINDEPVTGCSSSQTCPYEFQTVAQPDCCATKLKHVWKSPNCCTNSQTTHDKIVCATTCVAQNVWPFMGPLRGEGQKCLPRRHSSPYCCWSLWWISADGTFSPTRNLIIMRCSTLRGTFCSLITLATPRQDWTGSNPSRREGGGCGFIPSRSHSCCTVRLVYTQISPGHIWTTL